MTQRPVLATDFDHFSDRPGLLEPGAGVTPKACDLRSFAALILYLALSIAFFGRALIGNLSSLYIGVGPDPALMVWSLVWWPHAVINAINPFLTHALFAPSGLNLTWQTAIPFGSAIVSPLTLTLGPVVAYNVLCLASVALDAWCAFILCRYLSRHYWASFLGGAVFGFSAFFLGHLIFGDLHMLLAPALPLIVYFGARRFAGDISQGRLALVLTPLLIAQFLQSLEIFATMTMFAAMVMAFGYVFVSRDEDRARVLSLVRPVIASYVLALTVVSPFLYYFLFFGFSSKPVWPPDYFNTDLLNLVIPTQVNQIGRLPFFASISTNFPGGSIAENGSYLTLPLIVIAVLYARRNWREPLGRLLTDFLIVVCVLSLGPVLHVAGHQVPSYLPWRLFELPILRNAMAVRLTIYAYLDLAIITSLWFATAEISLSLRLTFAALVITSNLPNLSAAFWTSAMDTPAFFRTDAYKRYLSKGETVLVLPYGQNGNAMLWQAQTDMYFKMPEGGAGVRMEESRRWPIVQALEKRTYIPRAPEQLATFLAAHGVTAVVVTDDDFPAWQALLSKLGPPAIRLGGISLYRVPAQGEHDLERTLLEAREHFDEDRLRDLVMGAHRFLSNGGNLHSLSAVKAADLDVISRESLLGPTSTFDPSLAPKRKAHDPRLAFGVWLAPWPGDRVSVGEFAFYPAVAPLIERLRPIAGEIYFPYPSELKPHQVLPESQADGFLLMTFTREQLARAAELLETLATPAAQASAREVRP